MTVIGPPSITTAAAATPGTVTGATTQLSVGAADAYDLGSQLTYAWSTASAPSGASDPIFSANGTDAEQDPTVTFNQAGTYTFLVTITNPSA